MQRCAMATVTVDPTGLGLVTSFVFDAQGDQTGSDVYGAVNALNQYAAMTPNGAGTQSLSYDTRGNLTGDGVLTLAYDPENRLVTASKTGMSATYAYDPSGRRKTKTVNGTVTNFLHDGDTEIAEYDGGGTLLRRYVPGPAIDHPIAMVTAAGVKTLFHTDKLGSVVAMSNATNGQLAEGPYTYDSWGNCFSGSAPCSAGVPFRYTGQRLDPETGLYHYKARCYSAAPGRFCQTDPIGPRDNINLYVYTGNDPTDLTDPTGLWGQMGCEAPCKSQIVVSKTTNSNGSINIDRVAGQTNGYAGPSDILAYGSATLDVQRSDPGQAANISAKTETKILDLSHREDNKTVHVTSGIRTPAQNAKVGGATHSAHLDPNSGVADITIPGYTLQQTFKAAYSSGEFSRVALYKDDGHVHVDDRAASGPGTYEAVAPSRDWHPVPPPQ